MDTDRIVYLAETAARQTDLFAKLEYRLKQTH